MLRKKVYKKITIFILVIYLAVNPALVRVALAEDVTPTPTPTESAAVQTTPTPLIEATPTEAPVTTTDTGDANADSQTDTTVNTTTNTIPGEVTTPDGTCTPPEGQTTCGNDLKVNNDNSAEVGTQTDAAANTGGSDVSGTDGDVVITSGDATASGTANTEVNTDTVVLEPSPGVGSTAPPGETVGTSATTSETTSLETEEKSLTVENKNEAEVGTESTVVSTTGDNLASENLGDVKIVTGDALALANILNLLNTNIVGSNFEVLLLNLVNENGGEINLNELWQQLQEKQAGSGLSLAAGSDSSNLSVAIKNQNDANLTNDINVGAGTGGNEANGNGSVDMTTGDAKAVANVANMVNTNIYGADFLFTIINIIDPKTGDLVLPRSEMFGAVGSSFEGSRYVFANNNQADIGDNVSSLADTGGNESNNNGDSLMTTGEATAHSNSFSLVNLNISQNNWFFLIINNLGHWSGSLFGRTSPSSQETPANGTLIHEVGLGGSGETGDTNGEPDLNIENQNKATLRNNISTIAETGGNEASDNKGQTTMKTGDATSLANLFNLVNLNIVGGKFFMGIVNILGDWSGNAVFAYPDVATTVSGAKDRVVPGETTEYTLNFANQGYDDAHGVSLVFELPTGMSYVSDNSGLDHSISGQTISWGLGDLEMRKGGNFTVTVRVSSDFRPGETVSWWQWLIPQAHAAEEEKSSSLLVRARIATADPDSDNDNNSSSVTTVVYQPTNDGNNSNTVDDRQPVLEITAKNNVNDFVYTGDTVTFEITVKNTSSVPSYNSHFQQKLYNGAPDDFGTVDFDLGTIEPGKGGKLVFGLQLADGGLIAAGHYRTIAIVTGQAPDGKGVSSNEARTYFDIKLKSLNSLFEAKAEEKQDEVLGSSTINNAVCPKDKDILPYVLLFLLSSVYITTWSKQNWLRQENEKIS